MSKPFAHMFGDVLFNLLALKVKLSLRKYIHAGSKIEYVQNCMIDAKHTDPFENSATNDTTKLRKMRPS
mgnify:FL=1